MCIRDRSKFELAFIHSTAPGIIVNINGDNIGNIISDNHYTMAKAKLNKDNGCLLYTSMLFDRGIVAPGVDAGYVDSPSAFGGKAFPGEIRQYNPGTQPFLKVRCV